MPGVVKISFPKGMSGVVRQRLSTSFRNAWFVTLRDWGYKRHLARHGLFSRPPTAIGTQPHSSMDRIGVS